MVKLRNCYIGQQKLLKSIIQKRTVFEPVGQNYIGNRKRSMHHLKMAACIEGNESNVVEFINSFDTVLTDCDGKSTINYKSVNTMYARSGRFCELG